ncbi:MAG: hypothetical protein K0B11_18625 [Mariniphaga sp.]|nr:hypothetical protein [Mariniphaga sp.]
MKTYKKNYIGKGTENANITGLVRMTIPVEDVLKFKHEFEGVEYFTFEMAPLREPDRFGRTHTAWVTSHEEEAEPAVEEKPAPKGKRKRKPKPEPADENLPF